MQPRTILAYLLLATIVAVAAFAIGWARYHSYERSYQRRWRREGLTSLARDAERAPEPRPAHESEEA